MAQYVLLSPVVTLFLNATWKPIKKHIGYCLNPVNHVRNLEKAADDLRDTIDAVEEKIQLREYEGKRPRAQVIRWVQRAHSVNDESHRIKNDYEARTLHVLGCSWNCFFTHSISSAATKKKIDVDEMKKRSPQNDCIFSLLPPVGRELPLPPNIVGQSEYRDKILDYIKQGSASVIGICGMGGAGKTTLLKQLNNMFCCPAEVHEFDHVIYVDVGQQQNLENIQQTIASHLGLTLAQNGNITYKCLSLCNFLKERKFLLLLDDLWQTLDLEKVGIPQVHGQIGPQNRQTIIITTRLQQVCYGMKEHVQIIVLKRLELNDARSLFEANAGMRITNNAQIRGYANSIVKKCGGLPLAIKIVGRAMASKENENEWKHAVKLLEQSQFDKVPDSDNDLYSVLYFSYDHLPDERTKLCFLFFALASYATVLGERYIINFWMGHGLLDEDDDTTNSYLRGHSVLGCLKRACLFEEHRLGEKYFTMHDCIRDLALWIVATQQGDNSYRKWLVLGQEEHMDPRKWKTSERIHLWGNVTIPDSRCYPHLLTLTMRHNSQICKLPTGFFETAPSLIYLDLSDCNIEEVPSDIGTLGNLQHLDLSYTPIRSLPMELKLLKNLRYLYLSYTVNLQTVPDGTISALSMLRGLDLYNSALFLEAQAWPYLYELESLTSLQLLDITVGNFQSLSRIFNLSRVSLRSLVIRLMTGLKRLEASAGLITKTRAQQLEGLLLCSMQSLEELVIGETNVDSDWSFWSLDLFRFLDLTKLKNIVWRGVVPYTCFPGVRKVEMIGCHSIKTVTWIKQLPCLEEVYLINCNSLLELVSDEEEGIMPSAGTASFPRLKHLGLSRLRNLQNICDGAIAFLCLQCLLVYKCPMLQKLPSMLQSVEHVPLILGEWDWWENLDREDASLKSNLISSFRELPPSFQGYNREVFGAIFLGCLNINTEKARLPVALI